MHYYSHHISDYMSHTGHLNPLEDIAYRRCLDIYYLHEKALPEDASMVARKIRMPDNVPEVKIILEEFFTHDVGKGWINSRGEKEIKKYHSKVEAASRAGKASALARSNVGLTDVQLTNNHKPITNNHKPINKTLKRPRNVSKKTWEDFLVHRKNKKAPLTETALIGIKNEVKKTSISLEDALVMCQARGWQSFKSDWVADKQKSFATTSYGEGEQEI